MLLDIDHPLFMCTAFGYRNMIPVYVPENVSAGGISKWKLSIEKLLLNCNTKKMENIAYTTSTVTYQGNGFGTRLNISKISITLSLNATYRE